MIPLIDVFAAEAERCGLAPDKPRSDPWTVRNVVERLRMKAGRSPVIAAAYVNGERVDVASVLDRTLVVVSGDGTKRLVSHRDVYVRPDEVRWISSGRVAWNGRVKAG